MFVALQSVGLIWDRCNTFTNFIICALMFSFFFTDQLSVVTIMCFMCFFWFSLDYRYFVLVLFAFVVS